MALRLLGDCPVDRPAEGHQHAVLGRVPGERKLDRLAGVPHALEAAVAAGVGSPAGQTSDVKLAISRIESAAVNAGFEITRHWDNGTLRLPVDLVAKDQKIRPRAEREMDHLPFQRSPAVRDNLDLGTAGVVQPARQVDQRQVWRTAVAWAAVAVMAARTHLVDHRRRNPFSLRIGYGQHAACGEAQPVGIAKARGHDIEFLAVRCNPQQTLLARDRVKVAAGIALEAADEVVAGR